jgi:hypothetical protein
MRARLRKLDRIVADFRDKGTRVTQGVAELEGIRFRKTNDADGGLRTAGKDQRARFIWTLEAENFLADT